MLRPYKFLVTPVIQQVDDNGDVVSEASPEQPDVIFGVQQLARYAEIFEEELAKREAATSNGVVRQSQPIQPTRQIG